MAIPGEMTESDAWDKLFSFTPTFPSGLDFNTILGE